MTENNRAWAYTPELNALLDRLEGIRPDRNCHSVFPTRDGNKYTARGFMTLWQRCVTRAVKEKVLTAETCFTFHELRAHFTTYFKAQFGALPESHANPATTAKVYERSKEVRRQSL